MDEEKRLAQNRETFVTHRLAFIEGKIGFLGFLTETMIRLSVNDPGLKRNIQIILSSLPDNPYDPSASPPFAEQFDAGWNKTAEEIRNNLEHGSIP